MVWPEGPNWTEFRFGVRRKLSPNQTALDCGIPKIKSKKPKIDTFNPDWAVHETIDPKPAPYALGKVGNLEYIKLDYFTIRGCREVQMDNYKSISHDTLAFMQLEDTIMICPLASLSPSKHIRNDEDLSWEEMLGAKNMMLSFMAKSGV